MPSGTIHLPDYLRPMRDPHCTIDGPIRDLPSEQSVDKPEVCDCCIEAFYVACPACGSWVRDLAEHDYDPDPNGPTCAGQDREQYREAMGRRRQP